jgi:ribonucleotide monophosphatase NagD (HAD superfamily)
MDLRPKTIICDIDGTLTEHVKPNQAAKIETVLKPLDGSIDKLLEWERSGYNIILLTGRKESMREATEAQLRSLGIFYDHLVMGVGGGSRHLINDCKNDGTTTAYAYNLERNEGISSLQI